MKFIYNGATTDNGFDKFGHYQRTNILISSCVQYAQVFNPSCSANFGTGSSRLNPASREAILKMLQQATGRSGGTLAVPDINDSGDATGLLPALPAGPASPSGAGDQGGAGGPSVPPDATGPSGSPGGTGTSGAGATPRKSSSNRGGNAVLNYLLGP